MNRWLPLVALALAQFVMVLDQAVMNVSISQLVEDFDTTATRVRAAAPRAGGGRCERCRGR